MAPTANNNVRLTKHFEESFLKLLQKGGQYQRAANQVKALVDKIKSGDDDPFHGMRFTKHGENRIKKCQKYDLSQFCRLVVIRDNGYLFFCFVGTHDDSAKWLDNNRGCTVKVDDNMRAVVTYESIDIAAPESRLSGKSSNAHGKPFDHVAPQLREKFLQGVDQDITLAIKDVYALTDDDEILRLSEGVAKDKQNAMFDFLMHLRSGDIRSAENTIRTFIGELQPINKTSQLRDSEDVRTLPADIERYWKEIEHYSKTQNYKEWMLYMHPDQEEYVLADYPGSAKIAGVSGSGKTCVVVKRAIHLASRYPGEKILVLTLNRSLATLINELVDVAASDKSARERIEVSPFFNVCQNLLGEFDARNSKLYDETTWKSKEHIDDVWMEYYRCEVNNRDAAVLHKVHDHLIAKKIDAERYIREEFDWIRSAVSKTNRDEYLELHRTGRAHPMDKTFRTPLLKGLLLWEEKMKAIGVSDHLGLATALYRYINKIRPQYRCILVDETQDFGTLELEIIRKLAKPQDNDLFFCGDAAQQVSPKHQNFKDANINIPSARSKKLQFNYRNSRQILLAAHQVLEDNLVGEPIDNKEFEVVNPRASYFSGPPPLLFRAASLSQEIAAAKFFIEQELKAEEIENQKACIAVCGYTLHELQNLGNELQLPVLDGERGIDVEDVFISDLESCKGFEFHHVCILNCSADVIPYPQSPTKERFRDLARLYVAMTRARRQLVLSYVDQPSLFLKSAAVKNHLLDDTWLNYLCIKESDLPTVAPPEKLKDVRNAEKQTTLTEMAGEQFLYTDAAIGLPADFIDKLRKLINGKQDTRQGKTVSWRNFAEAEKAIDNNPAARQLFGKNLSQFRELLKTHRAE